MNAAPMASPTASTSAETSPTAAARTLGVAAVGFINARPLIWGLDKQPDLKLQLDVPSKLLGRVQGGQADVGLLPAIDYQRFDDLVVVPVGGIGCDGPTLTVRLFSSRPIEETTVLACDPDSHTSVALARIILAERHNLRPKVIDLRDATGAAGEVRLLIGDKVVCEEPAGLEHQLDLGHAWKELTGLPFLFAVWMARRGVELRDLPQRLADAWPAGLANVDTIIQKAAVPRGWPAGLALQYLTVYLKFGVGDRQLEAMRRFHELAHKHGLIERVRPIVRA
jgi:chorismate dehydratase